MNLVLSLLLMFVSVEQLDEVDPPGKGWWCRQSHTLCVRENNNKNYLEENEYYWTDQAWVFSHKTTDGELKVWAFPEHKTCMKVRKNLMSNYKSSSCFLRK